MIEATAAYHGGYHATVTVRGHTISVDEPPHAGGDLPGLTVTATAERAGRELRYHRLTVTARADVPLAPYMARARRLCWVSNTFHQPPEIDYRTEDQWSA